MIEDLVQELAFNLEKFGTGAYLLVTLLVLLETLVVVGQFIPGSLFLILVGFLCYMDVFDLYAMGTSVFLARLGGEYINYALGRYRGRSLFHAEARFLKPRFLDMATTRFESSGAKLLITGQFLGFLRPFITMAAGAAQYSLVRFTIAVGIGGLMWSALHLGLGFVFGASWQQAIRYLKDFSLVLLVAVPLALFSGWCIRQLLQLSGSLYRFLERLNRLIRRNQTYQRLLRRHPRFVPFLERRVSLSKEWGLAATFGFFCALLCLAACMLIMWDVHTKDNWFNFDVSLVNLLAQLRTPGADRVFLVITHLGAAPVVSGVVVLAAILCLAARQHKSLFVIVGSVVLSLAAAYLLEIIFRRTRPDLALQLVKAKGFSFPSSRATVAFALFGSLYYWLWNHPGVLRVRATLAFVLLMMAFLVGFSRIYLGVHYPSDIVSGFCLGFAAVLTCGTIAANWRRLADVQRRADLSAAALLTLYGLGAWYYSVNHSLVEQRTVVEKPRPLASNDSLQEVLPHLPRQAKTLFGAPYVPVSLLIMGEPQEALKLLERNGFKTSRASDFFTRSVAHPVFPAFLDGTPAAYTLERRGENGRRIVRLWRTTALVGEKSVWLGSAVDQKRVVRWRVDNFRQTPDVDFAMEDLAKELAPLNPEFIPGFRPRGMYHWRNEFFTYGGLWSFQQTADVTPGTLHFER